MIKSYLTFLEEGRNDPAIFKAIFLAGGPGSGKSFVVGQTALTALGFKVVNSDTHFEKMMAKAGMELSPEQIFTDKGQKIRQNAVDITSRQQQNYISGRLGIVIDGTGKNLNKILSQSKALKELGYETGMIFVNTTLKRSIEGDAKRRRTIGADKVTELWNQVQSNLGQFDRHFGDKFYVIDNHGPEGDKKEFDKQVLKVYKSIQQWAKTPPKSPIAQKWIKSK